MEAVNFQDDINFTIRRERGIVAGQVQSPVILLFFIIGLPWNALVIGIILKKKLFTRPSIMLLLNLATANFLACLLVMPFPVVFGVLARSYMVNDTPAYDKVCQSGILLILLQLVSIYTVGMISVDRVIYLKKPLTYHLIITPWRMFLAIMILWAAVTIVSLLPLLGFGYLGYYSQLATCLIRADIKLSYFVLIIVLSVLGTLMQFVGCGWIIYITRKHLMARALYLMGSRSGAPQSSILSNYKKSQLQLVKVFGVIFTASLATTLPVIVFTIVYPIIGTTPSVYPLYPIAYIFMLFKPVIYPILESYMTNEIRKSISMICKSSIASIRRQCTTTTRAEKKNSSTST